MPCLHVIGIRKKEMNKEKGDNFLCPYEVARRRALLSVQSRQISFKHTTVRYQSTKFAPLCRLIIGRMALKFSVIYDHHW